MKWDMEFIVPYPRILTGKKKGQLLTLNTLPYFYRYGVTKHKNAFKNELCEWYIPKCETEPNQWAEIHMTILRNTKRKMDSDNIALVLKWAQDVLVQQAYLIDDDKNRVVLEPTQLGVKGVETSIKVQVKFHKGEKDDS
jgi:hypothetical protein